MLTELVTDLLNVVIVEISSWDLVFCLMSIDLLTNREDFDHTF